MPQGSPRREPLVRVVLPRGHAQPPWVAVVVGLGVAAVAGAVTAMFAVTGRIARAGFPDVRGARPSVAASDGADVLVHRFGALFAVIGLGLAAYGVIQALRGAQRRAARRAAAASRGANPWLSDHPWSRTRAEDESPREGWRAVRNGGVMLALIGAFAAALLGDVSGTARTVVLAIAGVFGCGALAFVGWGGHRLLRRMRHGRLELRFTRFPYFLGGALEAELVRESAGAPLGQLQATLRCVQEVRTFERSGEDSGWTICRSEVWSETRQFHPSAGRASRVAIRFELPAAPGLSTELSVNPPRYWELEVWSQGTARLDLGGLFLVPVYAAPLETRLAAAPRSPQPALWT